MHLFVLIVFRFFCITSWCSSHYVVTIYTYIYLQFSKKWRLSRKYIFSFINTVEIAFIVI
jgi:hypothetical protein